jgi:hypothetical protein
VLIESETGNKFTILMWQSGRASIAAPSCERALEDVVSPCAEQEKERRVTLTEF